MKRGGRALGAAALLVSLATAIGVGLAAQAWGGTDGAEKLSATLSRPSGSRGTVSAPPRVSVPLLRFRNGRHLVPIVFAASPRRFGIFLLRLSWPDHKVYGPSAVSSARTPDAASSVRNRTAEPRSRAVLRYNISSRVGFVGVAQGSRLRMLRVTLAMFGNGARTVRRALAPHLRLPGLTLSLGGISVQAGIRVRLF